MDNDKLTNLTIRVKEWGKVKYKFVEEEIDKLKRQRTKRIIHKYIKITKDQE